MIPRNIIQFWHDNSDVPEVIAEAMAVTKSNNSNYSIIRADDNFMYNFIENNYNEVVLKLYKNNKISASRSDIARLMLLYEYGGFYIDASMELQENLDKLYDDTAKIIVVQRDNAPVYKNCPEKAHVINGFIAVPRKSEIIKWCIDQVLINMISGEYNTRVNLATGPNIIHKALIKYENLGVKKLLFTSLFNNFFIYRRVTGINNSWVCLQSDGIIDPAIYKKGSKRYRKLWLFKRIAIHLSFDFFFLKNN